MSAFHPKQTLELIPASHWRPKRYIAALPRLHGPASLRQIDLRAGVAGIEAVLPREDARLVGPHDLQAVEVVAAIEPAVPAEVGGVMALCDREQVGLVMGQDACRAHAPRRRLAVAGAA